MHADLATIAGSAGVLTARSLLAWNVLPEPLRSTGTWKFTAPAKHELGHLRRPQSKDGGRPREVRSRRRLSRSDAKGRPRPPRRSPFLGARRGHAVPERAAHTLGGVVLRRPPGVRCCDGRRGGPSPNRAPAAAATSQWNASRTASRARPSRDHKPARSHAFARRTRVTSRGKGFVFDAHFAATVSDAAASLFAGHSAFPRRPLTSCRRGRCDFRPNSPRRGGGAAPRNLRMSPLRCARAPRCTRPTTSERTRGASTRVEAQDARTGIL